MSRNSTLVEKVWVFENALSDVSMKGYICSVSCLSSVPKHGVFGFGKLLSTDDLQHQLSLSVSW